MTETNNQHFNRKQVIHHMKAFETAATFNEKGEMAVDRLPDLKNKRVKLLFLFDDEAGDDFYGMAASGLAKAYAADEPEYDASMIKEPNPLYKHAGR